MNCKDCVHYEVCNRVEKQIVFTDSSFEEVINSLIKCCRHFKNKADFVEVKHGRWEKRSFIVFDSEIEGGYRCSECNTTWDTRTNYCPNCGAKMIFEKEGADNG